MKRGKNLSFDLMQNLVASPSGAGAQDERKKRLLRVLGKAVQGELTPRQRECVRLLYQEGVSQKEIAARLGLQPATVSKHLKRARERLRRVLRYYL